MLNWTDYGFRENPYSTRAIEPTDEGVNLLVGRVREVRRLHAAITASDTHPSIEGRNGVGKTSLAQVTAYLAQRGAERELTSQIFVPLGEDLELTPDATPELFTRRVCYAVVEGFKRHRALLKQRGLSIPDTSSIDHWLNQPLFRAGGIASPGGGFTRATTPSTTAGFAEDGFIRTVFAWLAECFPSFQAGGFVCVLDNLELLESSTEARRFLEALRDSLLNRRGLRWVLCGSRGVVRGAVSSSRLNGVIGSPLELEPMEPAEAAEGLSRRIDAYRMRGDYYLPVLPTGFAHIYTLLNRNLRDTFKLCQDFALEESARRGDRLDEDERFDRLQLWLQGEGVKYRKAATNVLSDSWKVLDLLTKQAKGECLMNDCERLGIDDEEEFARHVAALARANLAEVVTSKSDPAGRDIVVVTANGWLVQNSRF
jgi:hypothetical protein